MFFREKKYTIKIYDKTGTVFLKTLNPGIVREAPSFNAQINGGYGECRVRLSLPFHDFGENAEIDFMNIFEIFESDLQNTTGRLIYRGFVSAYEPFISGSDQGVDVTLLGMVSLLRFAFYKNGANFSVTHSLQDTAVIMKAILDHFASIYAPGLVFYDGSSVDTVGNSVSYTFEEDKWFDALQNAFGTIGLADWYWLVSSSGRFFLKEKPSEASHAFTVGKDLETLEIFKTSEKVVNSVRVKYGVNTYDLSDAPSITEFWKREKILKDDKILNPATAQNKANQEIENNKQNKIQAKIVVNSNYDLESIIPGQTCRILNLPLGQTVLTDNMQIVSVNYSWDKVAIGLEEIKDQFGIALNKFINP